MEDFKVQIVEIERIEKHPNADRLELAYVGGWQVVVQKKGLTPGQLAVYFPIDSILPAKLEAALFPEGSKIKLSKSRVKTIKIRGAISQGMLVPVTDPAIWSNYEIEMVVGFDVTEILGVTKYEPPDTSLPASMSGGRSAKKANPFFLPYEKLSHFKNHPTLFEERESVIVTEKIHGTNFRAGWVPMVADTWFKKVKQFLGILPKWEFVFGSHRVQLQNKSGWNGYYSSNVYAETVAKYQLQQHIPIGYVVYGEIYGPGIQKGYGYGVPTGEHRLALFDVMVYDESKKDMQYLSWDAVQRMSVYLGVPTVPVIYEGPFKQSLVREWEQGPSLIGWFPNEPTLNNDPAQPHREGCVIKPFSETRSWTGRKVLRSINPEYLMVAETEFH